MRNRRFPLRLLGLFLLGSVLGLVVAEFAARLSFSKSVTELTAARVAFRDFGSQPNSGLVEIAHWEESLALHPFFGYVGRVGKVAVNRFGFFSYHEIGYCGPRLCLEHADHKTTVVGVFGGSLAGQVASDEKALEAKLAKAFPGRKVAVVNFALAGHSQPQAFFIYYYFRELVDVAVFFDGFNEIWNPVDNNRLGFPPIYTKGVHYRVLNAVDDRVKTNTLFEMRRLRETVKGATRRSLLPVWRNTALAHVLWDGAREHTLRKLRELSYSPDVPPFTKAGMDELIDAGVAEWQASHRQIRALARSKKARVLHFLQPTLLFPGVKALTDAEKSHAKAFPQLAVMMANGYPRLRAGLKEFGTTDLTDTFRNEKGEIWIDSAHVNERGIQHLRDEIASHLTR